MLLPALFLWIYLKCKKKKIKPFSHVTPPLAEESTLDTVEPSAPFQETLNHVKEHANRIKLEMTMELNSFTSQTSTVMLLSYNQDFIP